MDPKPSNSNEPTTDAPAVAETPITTDTSSTNEPAVEATTPVEPVVEAQPQRSYEAPVVETPVAASAPEYAPAAAPVQPVGENPGHNLGIASLILSIVGIHIVGLILGIIALQQSKKAGFKNGLALAGVIVGAAGLVLVVLYILFFVVIIAASL
jgi:hypothetical protein